MDADPPSRRAYPTPAATISLRKAVTFRGRDGAGQPVLIITDGVTTVALDSGRTGLCPDVVSASRRLADAVADFARSVLTGWQHNHGAGGRDAGPAVGRHRPTRRRRD